MVFQLFIACRGKRNGYQCCREYPFQTLQIAQRNHHRVGFADCAGRLCAHRVVSRCNYFHHLDRQCGGRNLRQGACRRDRQQAANKLAGKPDTVAALHGGRGSGYRPGCGLCRRLHGMDAARPGVRNGLLVTCICTLCSWLRILCRERLKVLARLDVRRHHQHLWPGHQVPRCPA